MLIDHYFRLPDARIWSTDRRAWVQANDWPMYCWKVAGGVITEAADEAAIDDALRHECPDRSPLLRRDIPTLAWIARLTPSEFTAIATAALSSPAMFVWLVQAIAAHEIDVLDPRTIAGIDALIAAGLIDAGRKADILRRGE